MDEYQEFPSEVENAFNKIRIEKLHQPIAEGKWTPYQILQHITDSELVYFRRVKRTLVEDNPLLLGWHPTEWIEMENSDVEIETNFNLIFGIRTKLTNILKPLSEDSWNRKVTHPRYGQLSLRSLIEQQTNHANSHLKAVSGIT